MDQRFFLYRWSTALFPPSLFEGVCRTFGVLLLFDMQKKLCILHSRKSAMIKTATMISNAYESVLRYGCVWNRKVSRGYHRCRQTRCVLVPLLLALVLFMSVVLLNRLFVASFRSFLFVAAAKLQAAQEELEELRTKAADGSPGDLPTYIVQCEKEIGTLQHRITQLREEIAWARREIKKKQEEAAQWDRLLRHRQADLALLRLHEAQLREEASEANARAQEAARHAATPAELADSKYAAAAEVKEHAKQALEAAEKVREEAVRAAELTLEALKRREEALQEAGEAEKRARAAASEALARTSASKEREQEAETRKKSAHNINEQVEETIKYKDDLRKLHALDQLHPMYLKSEDLIETAPPSSVGESTEHRPEPIAAT